MQVLKKVNVCVKSHDFVHLNFKSKKQLLTDDLEERLNCFSILYKMILERHMKGQNVENIKVLKSQ